ncbi:peroxiredoxin [Arthrobacter sp. H5]|uniref:peroxiredoxin n=1 Tax=Arthrobacter sp. H5 TaxID=1267973 RepID=UPI0004822D88|nr:peroxiredoxin [Arthrobacter sp. H5]
MTGFPAVGGPAPDFELSNQHGEPIRLSDLRGTAVALVFYPFAFSAICTGELNELSRGLPSFTDRGVRLLAISVDHKYTLRAYADAQNYGFDLLADFWPHGAVAGRYGVFDESKGFAKRSTFFIDARGSVVSRMDAALEEARPLAEYLTSLELKAEGK